MTSPPSSAPLLKSVSFNPLLDISSPAPSSSASPPPAPIQPPKPSLSRRRSSLKVGSEMPYRPAAETYQHPDPLLRRLRLNDSYGKTVDLGREFRDAEVVLFLFGATWPGSAKDAFLPVEQFATDHPHRLKVVYVSVDTSEKAFEANTRGKPWLSMEWNDGSNISYDSSDPSLLIRPEPTLEPFLLASEPDLEEEVSTTDTSGTLYLRPFSRVFLAQKLEVLGVPNLAVYHVKSRKMLSTHARIEMIKGDKADATWNKWQAGEGVDFAFGDYVHALRWTIGLGVAGAAYLVATRGYGMEDVIGKLSQQLTSSYLGV